MIKAKWVNTIDEIPPLGKVVRAKATDHAAYTDVVFLTTHSNGSKVWSHNGFKCGIEGYLVWEKIYSVQPIYSNNNRWDNLDI